MSRLSIGCEFDARQANPIPEALEVRLSGVLPPDPRLVQPSRDVVADERAAAGICFGGTVVTVLVGNRLDIHGSDFHFAAFLVDGLIFLAVWVVVRLRSRT